MGEGGEHSRNSHSRIAIPGRGRPDAARVRTRSPDGSPWGAGESAQTGSFPSAKYPAARPSPGRALRGTALALWVLLPSASGARVNGFGSRRYEAHPTGPQCGPARSSGTRAPLLPPARSARPPAPRHLKLPRGASYTLCPAQEQRRNEQTPRQPRPSPATPAPHDQAVGARHWGEPSGSTRARGPRGQTRRGAPGRREGCR